MQRSLTGRWDLGRDQYRSLFGLRLDHLLRGRGGGDRRPGTPADGGVLAVASAAHARRSSPRSDAVCDERSFLVVTTAYFKTEAIETAISIIFLGDDRRC